MQPYFTHKQFEFSSRQREMMLQLAESARLSLQKNRSDAADREETSLVALDQLLAELAKFVYHVGDAQYRKISLSAPLLMRLLFELMQQLGSKLDEPAPGQEAAQTEQLHLYYFLSYDLTYHYSMQEYWGFMDQFRSVEELERAKRYAHHFVNTAGMDEAAVFTALYNAAKPQGRGFLQDDPQDITVEEGAKMMEAQYNSTFESEQNHFDYVNGRRMKISRHDLERGYIDVTNYDEGNGAGAAQRAVEHLPRL